MNEIYVAIDDRHHAVLESGRLEILDELLHPAFAGKVLTYPGTEITGIDGYKDFVRDLRTAFPDLQTETVQRIGEGDVLVCHSRLIGTNDGEFMGVAPTGRRLVLDVVNILTFRDGKIAGMTTLYDAMGVAVQLGLLPEPAAIA